MIHVGCDRWRSSRPKASATASIGDPIVGFPRLLHEGGACVKGGSCWMRPAFEDAIASHVVMGLDGRRPTPALISELANLRRSQPTGGLDVLGLESELRGG